MVSELNPDTVLFFESRRLEMFANFWQRRIEIENAYLDNLSGLPIPELPGKGQMQELAHKTRELLMDELEERRRGLEKLQAAYKALTDEFWTEEGPSYFDVWGRNIETSVSRIYSLSVDIGTAESLAERMAVKAREQNFPMSSSAKRESQSRSNVLSRLLDKARNAQPYDTSSFLSADSAYRQKVQQINDEKYIIQNEIVPQTVHYAEHDRKCIVALRNVVSTFSAVNSDLAQVLNVTSSQLCIASSSLDASMESASFVERLDDSFTSLTQPYRYTSYETPSPLRPTTMLFSCPLPDELDGASIGQRAVDNAFKAILSSAAKKYHTNLYDVMCDAHKRQGLDQRRLDIRPSALQLESLWDPSQLDGGPGAVDYLANGPSDSLLVYFLARLPEPFLPLHDSDIKSLTKLNSQTTSLPVSLTRIIVKAGNRMGTARRCNLARLCLRLERHQYSWSHYYPEWIQIFTRTPDLPLYSQMMCYSVPTIMYLAEAINEKSLILPRDFFDELWD